jgi:regulator of protease activity HflC (stomatin/prohibitin superfamily)
MSWDDKERMQRAEVQRQEKRRKIRNSVTIAGGVLTSFVVLGIFFGSWYRVDEGERAVVLTNGSFSEIAGPGLNFKIPFFQAARFFSVRNEVISYDKMAAYSFDQQTAELRLSVNFQISSDQVERVYKDYGTLQGAVDRVINPKVYEQVKNVFGQYSAQRAIQERGKLNTDVTIALQNAVKDSGVQVISVQVENIDFSDSYELAVEAAVKAKADVERAKSELLRVEQEAQQKVKQAQAEAEAKKLQADADAYATRAAGEATAAAIRERGQALRDTPQLVDLVAAERWNGVLPTSMIPGSTVPFINLTPANEVQTKGQ